MDIAIGLLGFGTVGIGVYEMLQDNAKLSKMTGDTVSIKKILVNQKNKYQDELVAGLPITDQFSEILLDETIQIVVEVMGTVETARTYIESALAAGKNVVTANKDVLALYGEKLHALAAANHVDLCYEASVAGGIPIINSLMTSYIGDEITEVLGIVNGTTNFMLTQMQTENQTYEEALKLAQELGFAESDPSGDVEGLDAARKMVILTKLAFGKWLSLENMKIKGITGLDPDDFLAAEKEGYTIKLIGSAKVRSGKLLVEVAPMLVPLTHPLSVVKNENNAVFVVGKASGEMMFYGPGAGRMPTANSVVADIAKVMSNIQNDQTGKLVLYNNDAPLMREEKAVKMTALVRSKTADYKLVTDIPLEEWARLSETAAAVYPSI